MYEKNRTLASGRVSSALNRWASLKGPPLSLRFCECYIHYTHPVLYDPRPILHHFSSIPRSEPNNNSPDFGKLHSVPSVKVTTFGTLYYGLLPWFWATESFFLVQCLQRSPVLQKVSECPSERSNIPCTFSIPSVLLIFHWQTHVASLCLLWPGCYYRKQVESRGWVLIWKKLPSPGKF